MSHQNAGFEIHHNDQNEATMGISGDWVQGKLPEDTPTLDSGLLQAGTEQLTIVGTDLGEWDSALMAFLYQCHNACMARKISFQVREMPSGIDQLLALATTVKPQQPTRKRKGSFLTAINPLRLMKTIGDGVLDSLAFVGDVSVALWRLIRGKANTRAVDFWSFVYQGGPDAIAIISLTSILVGMILAYLGAVQLQQFGAEIYVADLVMIGTLREMGVLMTAIVMAGRTGAAYAAQLGTMQTNEEIDAITTMGISPMEFLVIPRMLALVAVMPLLTIYANILGVLGGGIVASGMGISPTQYINEGATVFSFTHISVGLIKSVVFGILIAVAGCRAGINSGRSSAAVGEATTKAVVTSIVYLIIADATINIIFQQLEM